jgi:hypothetical protein
LQRPEARFTSRNYSGCASGGRDGACARLTLAEGCDLVYAACNDAVPYAQIIAIEKGQLVRNREGRVGSER